MVIDRCQPGTRALAPTLQRRVGIRAAGAARTAFPRWSVGTRMLIDHCQPGDAPDASVRTQSPWRAWRAWRLGVRPLLSSPLDPESEH